MNKNANQFIAVFNDQVDEVEILNFDEFKKRIVSNAKYILENWVDDDRPLELWTTIAESMDDFVELREHYYKWSIDNGHKYSKKILFISEIYTINNNKKEIL